ncbi:MAG: hypothetical protein JNM28_11515 [Armatimonadetes bacterium]|nr:hypothetical protein [Armatimonadota bacterium]
MAVSGGISRYFRPGLESLQAMWRPMLIVQSALVLTVAGYFLNPGFQQVMERVAEYKDRGGVPLVLAVGFFAGGILPEIAKALVGKIGKTDRDWVNSTLYTGSVYMLVTFLVVAFFKLQVVLFGDSGTLGMVVKKVLVDQLIFSPFVSIPLAVGLFRWRKDKFDFKAWRSVASLSGYRENVLPALVMCWSYWGPITFAMYFLPERLQFVVSSFCQAAWSLLFVFLVHRPESHAPPE